MPTLLDLNPSFCSFALVQLFTLSNLGVSSRGSIISQLMERIFHGRRKPWMILLACNRFPSISNHTRFCSMVHVFGRWRLPSAVGIHPSRNVISCNSDSSRNSSSSSAGGSGRPHNQHNKLTDNPIDIGSNWNSSRYYSVTQTHSVQTFREAGSASF